MTGLAIARIDARHDATTGERTEILLAVTVGRTLRCDSTRAHRRAARECHIGRVDRPDARVENASLPRTIRGSAAGHDGARVWRSVVAHIARSSPIDTDEGVRQLHMRIGRLTHAFIRSVATDPKQSDRTGESDGKAHRAQRSRSI